MIAPEDEGESSLFERTERRFIEALAHSRNLADVLLSRIAVGLGFGNRRDEIPFVHDGNAERRQALAKTGDSKGGRAHVHAAPVAAKIERNANDVNGWGHRDLAYRCSVRRRYVPSSRARPTCGWGARFRAPVVPRETDTLGPGTNGQLAASYLTQELTG